MIKAREAWEAGIKFFDAGDVVLTEYIPPKYIKRQENDGRHICEVPEVFKWV